MLALWGEVVGRSDSSGPLAAGDVTDMKAVRHMRRVMESYGELWPSRLHKQGEDESNGPGGGRKLCLR